MIPVSPVPWVQFRPLPGHLNRTPVFNSNSPELVQGDGILLSTFPPVGKAVPAAHLNYPLQGRFDLFLHHVTRAIPGGRTLYLGVIVANPTAQPITLAILQGASYLTQPEAPFISLPPRVSNPMGKVYAGPGDRVADEILRGRRQAQWPALLVIPPYGTRMLVNLPVPVDSPNSTANARSALLRLRSNGPLYLASLALYSQAAPTLAQWEQVLDQDGLVTPRDLAPTPPNQTKGPVVYGRVAGVTQGDRWQAEITDRPQAFSLTIPSPGESLLYPISSLPGATLGTGQIQSAPTEVRYGDTAYLGNGNYGVEYSLTIPLHNPTSEAQTVTISLQTPQKNGTFLSPPGSPVFWRGTVRILDNNNQGQPETHYYHLVEHLGEASPPLARLLLPPGGRNLVQVDFVYPADCTPPQALRIETLPTPTP